MAHVDAELVVRAQQGDADAFELLVRRHLRTAHATALSCVDDADDAEDVVQDAFVTALRCIRDCREPAKFRAWLLTIVRNRAHNLRAFHAVRQTGRGIAADEVGGSADGPVLTAARTELRTHLAEAVATLTELQRSVLLLHDMEGWRHAEIGEHLRISAGASRFHLFVARRAVRARLAGHYDGESLT